MDIASPDSKACIPIMLVCAGGSGSHWPEYVHTGLWVVLSMTRQYAAWIVSKFMIISEVARNIKGLASLSCLSFYFVLVMACKPLRMLLFFSENLIMYKVS